MAKVARPVTSVSILVDVQTNGARDRCDRRRCALLFAATVFVWRVVFDDAPWIIPRLPRMEQFGAFEICSWILPSCFVAVLAILVVAAIRRRGRWIAPALVVVSSIATAVVYLPFWFLHARRIDRLLGEVREPVQRFRVLVVMAMLTLIGTARICSCRSVPVAKASASSSQTRRCDGASDASRVWSSAALKSAGHSVAVGCGVLGSVTAPPPSRIAGRNVSRGSHGPTE